MGAALAGRVAEAASLNEVLELGLAVTDHALADLPWETLQVPEPSGDIAEAGGSPLALHRNVALYRQLGGPGTSPAHMVKGPLRLLVAIASPEAGGGELLDYEDELARIVAAVESARKGQAYVRVLNEGSLAAVSAALREDPEGFHVLHLSCHARPGELILETADGEADPVSAERLLEEGVPAGADLPMVVLSGCSTGLGARQVRLDPDAAVAAQSAMGQQHLAPEEGAGEAVLASFAAGLVDAGVPQVLAMQATVTDRYATQVCAGFYRRLATDATPDPLLALAEVRRAAERERQALPAGSPERGPAEWATPTLTARGLRLPLFSRREPFGEVHRPQPRVLAEGVVVREVGEFVGRRRETREARRALGGQKAGLVLHGIGGVGKSTLAAEVLRSLGDDAGLVVSKAGQLSVDDVLREVGARLHRAASPADGGEGLAQAGLDLRAANVEWADRWRRLAEEILPVLPMVVLLDNFEDNLQADDGGWQVRDPELAALLAGWAARPGRSRLIFTSRYPFALPGRAERRLAGLHLGPLSAAETKKLIWRLPGLDALSTEDKDRAYRNVGGHPRTLEYLDALLRGGKARFDDVALRMEDRLRARGIDDPAAWLAAPGRDLNANLAEAVTLSVDDVLLSGLLERLSATPVAAALVIGASVYRVPVDDTALVFQVGEQTTRPADSERTARIGHVQQAIAAARERSADGQISLDDAGLSPEEYARYEADLAEERRPPVEAPAGLLAAVDAARGAGLLAPVSRGDQAPLHFVHRWTAGAIAKLHPGAANEGHRRAAAFWHWRVDCIPQSPQDDVDQLLEARYHHHAAGQAAEAVAATEQAVERLETWGQYGRGAELCRETLGWLTPGSQGAAVFHHWLGVLSQDRGDYDDAERLYRQAVEIFERLDDQVGMSAGYHHLGSLAQNRGDYDAAERLYRRALETFERLGDQARMSAGYGQLGNLAQDRGDYDAAERSHRRALEISESLGDREFMAKSYHQLGRLAQLRGDYADAEPLCRRALEIEERLGDQAGMARSYGELGIVAVRRGNYDDAERLHRQALEISERVGDQAVMAAAHHHLGILAQLREDYEAAGRSYRRALVIEERLGDQAGMAASYRVLAVLSEALGNLDESVAYQVVAFAIRTRIGMPAAEEAQTLAGLRRRLGNDRFRAALPSGLDQESADNLMQILDQQEQTAGD